MRTLPLPCGDFLEVSDHQPPETPRASLGPYRDSFTFKTRQMWVISFMPHQIHTWGNIHTG